MSRERSVRVGARAGALAYRVGWALARWFPVTVMRAVFRGIADYVWWRNGRAVQQLAKNLRRVVGDERSAEGLRALTRAALRSYLRYWLEVFRLPAIDRAAISTRFHVQDEDRLWQALESGRGVVLALPHSGNWDHAGAWIALSGYPFATVAERLQPESLYRRFVAFRERLGMEVLPLTGSQQREWRQGQRAQGQERYQRGSYSVLASRLRDGGLVCLLADRDLTASGVEVTFFGETARMPGGPATLALDTGAALLPITLWYEGEDWAGRVHPEVAVPQQGTRAEQVAAMTQRLADEFADSIAAHPQDWHMLQRLWTADLGARRGHNPRGTGT